MITRSIPPSDNYPGLIAHEYAPGRELIVIGSGKDAEEALRKAVTNLNTKRENTDG